MDESTQKAVLSLVSVVVGWFLGQGTELLRKGYNNRRIKKALLYELEDLHRRLLRLKHSYEESIYLCKQGSISGQSALKLNQHIYSKHYAEICIKLTHDQRYSYELIHGYIESINEKIVLENELAQSLARSSENAVFEQLTDNVKAQYINICKVLYYIEFHLSNPNNPDYRVSNTNEDRKYKKMENEVNRILS